MSSSKSLVINCGASHVVAAVFGASGGKLVLEELVTRELHYDLASDDAWLPALSEALRDMSRANSKIRGKATFILPGYQVFTKPIKVPHVEVAKQAQVIAFEAQNNMPFPLHEVTWGSQVIADDGVETDVILVALKTEQATRFCGLMASLGLQPVAVQPASLLEYNAFQLGQRGAPEESLLVNIGARSTNFTFVSGSGFFVRNINLGGKDFTQMLADGMGKSFAQAEEIKVAYFSGRTNLEADDPMLVPLQQKAQDFMRRLSQQITQSIIAYRRSSSRAAPQKILLSGRGSLLTGLPEFLSEAQKVSVEFFNPAAALSFGRHVTSAAAGQASNQLGEVVGGAVRILKKDAVGVNLLPLAIRQRIAFDLKKKYFVAAAFCLALAPAPMLAKYFLDKQNDHKEYLAVQKQLKDLQSVAGQIDVQKAQAQKLHDQMLQFANLRNSRYNWIQFFANLQDNLQKTQDAWLDTLTVDRETAGGAPGTPAAVAAAAGKSAAGTGGAATYKIVLDGYMLLGRVVKSGQDFDTEAAHKRIAALVDSFKLNPFVKKVEDENLTINFLPDGLVNFKFTLDIDPEKPL